jgi:cytochrome c peroxidase
MTSRTLALMALGIGSLGSFGCDQNAPTQGAPSATTPKTSASVVAKPAATMPPAPPLPATPQPLPELKTPEDNPMTAEKVNLGKQLFFDKRLSKDGSASCETCHLPDKGWADGLPVSTKVGGAKNTRHSPTLWNVGYNEKWYWDGRAETLEKQIDAAWKGQMGADPAQIAGNIAKVAGYAVQFKTVFNGDPSPDSIVKALAAFVRTLRSGDAPWDKYEKGDKKAVAEDAVRGWELFRNKAGCAACHAPPLFTDNGFHDTGIGFDKPEPDLGRGKITNNAKEEGAFKTPTLRSVTTQPPFFHDGRAATIEEAVDFMLAGGIKDKNKNLDPKLKPVKLSKTERDDLLAFIKSLEAPTAKFDRPKLPD